MSKLKTKQTWWLGLLLILIISSGIFFSCFWTKKPDQFSLQPESPKIILSFGVIGDPELDNENLQKTLAISKEKKLAFVVFPGDLTQNGTPKQLESVRKVLDQSGMQYWVIPGNHDLWYQKETGINAFSQYFGKEYFATQAAGINFIFLNNADEGNGMGQTQLSWFSQQLAISHQPSIIFSHIPFWHPESDYVVGYRNEELKKEAQVVLKLLCEQDILAVFNGHLHHTGEHEYTCDNAKKLRVINTGSVNTLRNWQLPRFLKVDIFEDKSIKIEEIEL